ncbi:hypothetical protein CCY01nite_44380 [Chitinophaga cymbidii]|uniref:Uncharacterized protein n=2 Tax=Chitinophaga cymbidii TaxID=1096750 RepID=A0A512RR57_9BACT|nr:hypothetical protein CCY01nite_44380 [Chitinophaga cymbidii]
MLAVLLVAGCSKKKGDDPASADGYYLRFKADGVQREYKQTTTAHIYYDADNLTYHCNLAATLTFAGTTKDLMTLFLVNKTAFTTGVTYRLSNGIDMEETGAVMPQVMISLLDPQGKPYTAQFLPVTGLQFDDKAEVRFSEITDKYVKGTFSGLAFGVLPERKEMKIEEGSFYLSIF